MNFHETSALLTRLQDDHVIVHATMITGTSVPLMDSPQSGAWALEAVETVEALGLVESYTVKRDESALGVTW